MSERQMTSTDYFASFPRAPPRFSVSISSEARQSSAIASNGADLLVRWYGVIWPVLKGFLQRVTGNGFDGLFNFRQSGHLS
jgi:hypothetical protein